jgi:hypothetical protein
MPTIAMELSTETLARLHQWSVTLGVSQEKAAAYLIDHARLDDFPLAWQESVTPERREAILAREAADRPGLAGVSCIGLT